MEMIKEEKGIGGSVLSPKGRNVSIEFGKGRDKGKSLYSVESASSGRASKDDSEGKGGGKGSKTVGGN